MVLDLKFYLSIFWRRFPYFLVVATLIGAIGVSVASVLPPTYRAEALLLVENPQIPTDMASSTVQVSAAQEIAIIQQRLTTRANLIDTAHRLDIYGVGTRLSPDEIVADMRRRIRITSAGLGGREGGAPTVRVGFHDSDPRLAAQVVNEFVGMIERENVEMRRGLAGETLRFFNDEVARLSEEISIRRSRILDFRLANRDSLPDSLEFRRSRQNRLDERLRQMEREDATLQQQRDQIAALFEATGRLSNEPSQLERELANAQDQLQTALRLYSAQNPRVRVIEARVQELEGAVADQAGGRSAEAEAEFQRIIAAIEQSRLALVDERTAVEAEIAELQETINQTAVVGIRLSELERELAAVESQHRDAASRLAQAQMGERIELLSKGQRISVLEQATIPREPSSPNRPVIAAAGVGGGLAAGIGLIVLLELLNRSIRRPIEITRKMGITPIATLPYIRSRRQQFLRRMVIVAAFLFALVGVPGTLWALHTFYLPLDLLIDRVMERSGIMGLLNNFR